MARLFGIRCQYRRCMDPMGAATVSLCLAATYQLPATTAWTAGTCHEHEGRVSHGCRNTATLPSDSQQFAPEYEHDASRPASAPPALVDGHDDTIRTNKWHDDDDDDDGGHSTVPRHLRGAAAATAAAASTTTPIHSPPPAPPLLFLGRNDRSTFGDVSGQPMTEASDIDALIDTNDPTLNLSMLSRGNEPVQCIGASAERALLHARPGPACRAGIAAHSDLCLPGGIAGREAQPDHGHGGAGARWSRLQGSANGRAGDVVWHGACADGGPCQVLDELGVDLYVDSWTENLRMWLSSRVFKHVVQLLDEAEREMPQQGLAHLDAYKAQLPVSEYPAIATALDPTKHAATTATTAATGFGKPLIGWMITVGVGGFGQTSTAFGMGAMAAQPQQPPQTLVELVQRYPKEPLTRKRIELERYLNMPGFTCRDYIISRIKELATGGVLSAYRWDGGALVWNGDKKWTPEMPCDAQLILHLFCTFLDLVTPDNDATFPMNVPFSSVHYLAEGTKPDSNVAIQIKQVKKYPPHYCLVVDNKCWDIYPKRNNLFHTLVLFTFYANTKCAGYLGLLKLASKSVGLADVVAE
ncbi:cytochrome B561, N terminal-domain-containing protein [Syncephalis pseudoplumigaleata]|uniref:Cytochrome B561, N terminal-domain-containing protein n=1 Tax=Syncephalis pseudoplumigaleata TaxID=1712513 RepID=A0A4P9YYW9_9FUNG|nr:cytochrome B561, N terminal-domain-containing protein [Syncephalis pseudoplumigaleata]|eukprot:RKP25135.1 cytochrome B561, N terminal-domain-containing protein [Syncephalis pseudoplumigaleata]